MHTYKNQNGFPILRSCYNCVHFKPIPDMDRTGHCKNMPLLFAYTLDKSVYAFVKTYYLCDSHRLANEDLLENSAEKVDLKEILKKKKDL